jgi:hypothetical protein
MDTLLECLAKQNSRYFVNLLQTYKDESQAVVTTPSPWSQTLRATEMARVLAQYIPTYIGDLEKWIKEVEITLSKKGLNKNSFRNLMGSGLDFLRACQELIETADNACKSAESFSKSQEIQEARNVITETSSRLKELESKMLIWKKVADRQPPEIDPALIERGADQIRQGQFKTGEQILEEIRSRDSSK